VSRIKQKFIKWGTGTDDVNARNMPSNFTASNYTPAQVGSEGSDKVSSHLKGIDTALGSITGTNGDIAHTSFTAADNQASPANITGFAFANGTVRSFKALVSIIRGSTYEVREVMGIQKAASWTFAETKNGDNTGVEFSMTTGGQMQYTSTNTGNTATIKFRAIVTQV
jgi:hypothetical protein